MTSRTLLFNMGIFKNTLKRFKWGSVLYFIILFFSLPFIILVEDFERLVGRYAVDLMVSPILLRSDYIAVPILLTIVVPTIVAVLIFNNVHSSKQGVFVHGLPVTRGANYVSSVLAGIVLMALPILFTSGILLIMSFTVYGQIISSWSVVYWAALNLSMIFIMFSVAVFTALLTGNAAAHIGINVFVHLIPIIIALIIFLISDIFLFGFMQAEGFIGNKIMENTPIVWLFGKAMTHYRGSLNLFKSINMWVYLIGATVVYVLGCLVYKKRKIETCGDVAAFKVFGPILKYAVVSAAAAVMFTIFTEMGIGAIPIFIIAVVTTATVYFAAEMLMNKSFRVFGKYKGYLVFLLVCALFISFFAFTNVFGYETRVPDTDEIQSAAVFSRWSAQPHIANEQIIEKTKEIHQKLIEDIPVVSEPEEYEHLRVSYKLKNGKTIERAYKVSRETVDSALSEMYKFSDYKMKVTDLDNLNIENITRLNISAYAPSFGYNISLSEGSSQLMSHIKKDIEELSYAEIEQSNGILGFNIDFSYSFLENQKLKVFKTFRISNIDNDHDYVMQSFNININPNFKNTFEFLKERGYYSEVINQMATSLCICKNTITRDGEVYSYKEEKGDFGEFQISPQDCVAIRLDDAIKLAETMAKEPRRDTAEGKNYFVFSRAKDINTNIWFGDMNISFPENELPEYLKKYVN